MHNEHEEWHYAIDCIVLKLIGLMAILLNVVHDVSDSFSRFCFVSIYVAYYIQEEIF